MTAEDVDYQKSPLVKELNYEKMGKEELIDIKGKYAMEITKLKTIKYSWHDKFDILVKSKKYRTREMKKVLRNIRLLNTDIEILRDYYQICRELLKEKFNYTL